MHSDLISLGDGVARRQDAQGRGAIHRMARLCSIFLALSSARSNLIVTIIFWTAPPLLPDRVLTPFQDGYLQKPKVGRKSKKEIKGRQRKVTGTAKAKVTAGKKKK